MLLVPEILGHGQAAQRHAHTHAGALVHLAEHEGGLVDDAALPHLAPEIVALAGALADAGEHAVTVVLHGDVVDQLLDQDGLAHAGAAEEADLAAPGVGLQQVDDLDAGLEDLDGGADLVKAGGLAVDAPPLGALRDGLAAVDGLAQHVEHASQSGGADGDGDGAARRGDGHAAAQPLASGHEDAAHGVSADVLADLHDALLPLVPGQQDLADAGQLACLETDVHHGPGYLYDRALIHAGPPSFLRLLRWAFAPAEISVISCVMELCRSRLSCSDKLLRSSSALRLAASIAETRAFCSGSPPSRCRYSR